LNLRLAFVFAGGGIALGAAFGLDGIGLGVALGLEKAARADLTAGLGGL